MDICHYVQEAKCRSGGYEPCVAVYTEVLVVMPYTPGNVYVQNVECALVQTSEVLPVVACEVGRGTDVVVAHRRQHRGGEEEGERR